MTIVLTTNMEVIGGESPGATPADAIANASTPTALKVRTLGGFQAWVERKEVGSVLDGRRVQWFIWLYLLARELLRPANTISRPALMDELYPGIDPEQQRLWLRQQLFSMGHRLPKPMAACVTAQGESVQFQRRSAEWRTEQDRIRTAIADHQRANRSYLDAGVRLLELASRAADQFVDQESAERRELLRFVLSNSTWKGGKLAISFRQPFDLISESAAKTSKSGKSGSTGGPSEADLKFGRGAGI